MKITICFLLFCTLCAGAPNNPNENTNGILNAPVVGGISGCGLEILLTKMDYVDRNLLELKLKLDQHWKLMESIKTLQEKTLATTATATTSSTITPMTSPAMQTPKTTTTENPTPVTLTSSTTSSTTTTPKSATITITTANPAPTTTLKPTLPSSCKEIASKTSGVYLITVNNDSAPFNVYCEMEKFGGGWIVMQHRFDGSVDFYQNWTQYREGFGELDKEFWLGLERIHQLTNTRTHELMVEIMDFSRNYGYAHYSTFEVGNESEQYVLKTLGSYNGTAVNGMSYNEGEKFSTKDRDNDPSSNTHWAVSYHGGWWYSYDSDSNLNGQYKNDDDEKSNWWWSFKNDYRGLSFTQMMIREL